MNTRIFSASVAAVLMFGFQAALQDYFLIHYYGDSAFAFVVIDVLTFLYLVYSVMKPRGSGAVQWVIMSWTQVAKLGMFYWNATPVSEAPEIKGAVLTISFFMTPALYGVMVSRESGNAQSENIAKMSFDGLLQTDLLVHVMVDLLDVLTLFDRLDGLNVVAEQRQSLHSFVGAVVCVGVFLHALSYPSRGAHKNETFVVRKYAALVGMFAIDIPLAVARILLWVDFPENPGFDSWLVKNIVFVPIQAIRLRQCRLAEREMERESKADEVRPSDRPLRRSRSVKLDDTDHQGELEHGPSMTVADDDLLVSPDDVSDEEALATTLHHLSAIREVPVIGFGWWSTTKKILACVSRGSSMASYLDPLFMMSYKQQLRCIAPLLAHVAGVLLIGVMCQDANAEPIKMTDWTSIYDIPDDYRVAILTSMSYFVIYAACFFGLAPLIDVLFGAVFNTIRLACFFFVMVSLRDSHILMYPWLIWLVIVPHSISMLFMLKPIQAVLLGRKYTVSVTNLPSSMTIISSLRPTGQNDQTNRTTRDADISTSAVVVLLLQRYQIGPVAFNELLLGPDLISDIRLCDHMLIANWAELFLVMVVCGFSLLILFDWIHFGFFMGSLVMCAIYTMYSQAVRLLALRRYEVKITFLELLRAERAAKDDDEPLHWAAAVWDKVVSEAYFTSPGSMFPSLM